MASTIIGRVFPGIGHVPRHGIVRYRRIVDIRSLFTVSAGDMYQGDPHKALQRIQGHPLGTEIAEKLHLENKTSFHGNVISLILFCLKKSIFNSIYNYTSSY